MRWCVYVRPADMPHGIYTSALFVTLWAKNCSTSCIDVSGFYCSLALATSNGLLRLLGGLLAGGGGLGGGLLGLGLLSALLDL